MISRLVLGRARLLFSCMAVLRILRTRVPPCRLVLLRLLTMIMLVPCLSSVLVYEKLVTLTFVIMICSFD